MATNNGYNTNQPRAEDGKWTDGAAEGKSANGYDSRKDTTVERAAEKAKEKERITGAISGAVDPESTKGQEHAERYYDEMRKRKDDISSISKNTGFSESDIEKIKNYIFFEEHNLTEGIKRFDPDCYMAHSWQRLTDGKHSNEDMLLLHHELMELGLVQKGYSQAEAHEITNKKYNYSKAIRKKYSEKK